MRFLLLFLCFPLSGLAQVNSSDLSSGVNTDRFLRAIAEIETGNNNALVGRAGERSKYQFMRATWEQYSLVPHGKISSVKYAAEIERVAKTHLNWIQSALRRHGYSVTVYNCAVVWNKGFTGFRRYPDSEYGRAVENIY